MKYFFVLFTKRTRCRYSWLRIGKKKCFCDTHKSLSSAATGTKKCFCDTHKSLSSAATGTQKCFCDTHKSLNSAGTQKCIIW